MPWTQVSQKFLTGQAQHVVTLEPVLPAVEQMAVTLRIVFAKGAKCREILGTNVSRGFHFHCVDP